MTTHSEDLVLFRYFDGSSHEIPRALAIRLEKQTVEVSTALGQIVAGDEASPPPIAELLDAHGPYIDQAAEDAMDALMTERFASGDLDFADLARRTCGCGEPIDGFDGYVEHLRAVGV